MTEPELIATTDVEAEARQAPRGGKRLLYILLALDLVALLIWGWFYFSVTPAAKAAAERAEDTLVSNVQDLQNLEFVAHVIINNKAAVLGDPGELVMNIGTVRGIRDNIVINKANTRRFGSTRYEEVTVPVTFKDRSGFSLEDLVSFATQIEAKNPKIKIKKFVFGNRASGPGEDLWAPVGKALEVRVFRPLTEN